MMIKLLVACVACLLASVALGTPGGVDSKGCHNSQKIGYHCHPQSAGARGLHGGESQAQRDKRLKKECKGRSNSGLCEGFAR
jgi:hypothetical protein